MSSYYRDFESCTDKCRDRFKTPCYGVWGRLRWKSDITIYKEKQCNDICIAMRDGCLKRKARLIEERNEQLLRELQNNNTPSQPEPTLPLQPYSDGTTIYKWIDGNGVIHMTNDKDAVPTKYRKQLGLE